MLIELSVKNCFVFNNQIVFSLDPTNKTTAIYGPNNAGKTCLIKCIQAMKRILLNQRIELKSNLFFKWLCLWVGYYIWIWEKYIIILFIVLDVRCDIFFWECIDWFLGNYWYNPIEGSNTFRCGKHP